MSSANFLPRIRAWLGCTFLALLTLGGSAAWAQADPPGRVGRLSELQGRVSWFDHERGTWDEAERNRPLTSGDRLSTGPQGRAELRVGSTVLRLAGASELEVLRLDDERMSFQLHAGSLALRVRSREAAADIDLVTAEVRLRPERAGHYRLDRSDDSTLAGVWRGTLRIDDAEGFILETGQRAELWREGRQRSGLRFAWSQLPSDAFAEWVARDDQRDERSASSRYVSPEMTGAEDLDRYGRWDRHPEYGAVWYPLEVSADWAPYRHGRWAWVQPWGWTWVDEARWGFAPFHYGRWVSWRGRWGWVPGDYVARPVYAPALVAWVGGGNVSVSINIGGPTVGWVPLAPREWYAPHYRHTPVYVERINPHPPGPRGPAYQPPQQVPTGPVMYGNQGVPGGITIVSRDVLVQRQPVARGALDPREVQRVHAQQPWQDVPPPAREVPVTTVRPAPGQAIRPPREFQPQPQPQPQFQPQPQPQPQPQQGQPAPGGWQPGPAPERGDPSTRPQRRDPAPVVTPVAPPPAAAPAPPAAMPQPGRGGVVDPRRERPAPAAEPQPPARERERDRGDRGGPPRSLPGPAAPPAAAPAAPPAAPPPAPVAAPPRPAPVAVPAVPAAPAPVTAPPAPPRTAPMSPPERAREREAERERERAREQAKEEDRKRGPDNRGPQRERENQR